MGLIMFWYLIFELYDNRYRVMNHWQERLHVWKNIVHFVAYQNFETATNFLS